MSDPLSDERLAEIEADAQASAARVRAGIPTYESPADTLALVAEVRRLRESNTTLNRRATAAEAAVGVTVEDCRRQGVSLGRGLANAGYRALEAEVEVLRRDINDASNALVRGDGESLLAAALRVVGERNAERAHHAEAEAALGKAFASLNILEPALDAIRVRVALARLQPRGGRHLTLVFDDIDAIAREARA